MKIICLHFSGAQLKQEKEAKLKDLSKTKEEAERIKSEKEALKKDAEDLENVALEYYRKLEEEIKKKKVEEEEAKNRTEAKETFDRFDSNQDGLLNIPELQSRKLFDKDNDGAGELKYNTNVFNETILKWVYVYFTFYMTTLYLRYMRYCYRNIQNKRMYMTA